MTRDLRLSDPIPNLSQLFDAPSHQFSRAQTQFDNARLDLARLYSARDTTSSLDTLSQQSDEMEREAISAQIDDALIDTAWLLTVQRATGLAELVTKARYVQEFVLFDESNLESQLALSLCRDLVLYSAQLLEPAKSD
jgi:hypothetical protein